MPLRAGFEVLLRVVGAIFAVAVQGTDGTSPEENSIFFTTVGNLRIGRRTEFLIYGRLGSYVASNAE